MGAAHPHVDQAEAALRGTRRVHVAVGVDHDEAGGDEKAHPAWYLEIKKELPNYHYNI